MLGHKPKGMEVVLTGEGVRMYEKLCYVICGCVELP